MNITPYVLLWLRQRYYVCILHRYVFHITLLQMLHLTQRLIFSKSMLYAYCDTPYGMLRLTQRLISAWSMHKYCSMYITVLHAPYTKTNSFGVKVCCSLHIYLCTYAMLCYCKFSWAHALVYRGHIRSLVYCTVCTIQSEEFLLGDRPKCVTWSYKCAYQHKLIPDISRISERWNN
jgi:hypothetical protein